VRRAHRGIEARPVVTYEGDMPAALQAKLLRVLEDGEITPVGAQQPKAEPAPFAESRESEPVRPEPSVRVLSGPNLGRAVPFTRDELSVGRVGMQVAVVRKVGSGFRLVPVEGAQPPKINGSPVAPEGAALHPGDTFEVAGVRLELSVPA